MTMDPPSENGDGISCHGNGVELVAYGGLDPRCLGLDEEDLKDYDVYPQDEVFYEYREVDSMGVVHCKKTARFPGTDNGDIILTLELTYPEGKVDQAVIDSIMGSFHLPN